MFRLLDRYLFIEFSKNLLLVLSAFVGVYLLVDFFERIDNFFEVHLPISLAVRYFILKIPLIVEQLMPVSILMAGVITLGILNHHWELTALKAGGISMNRVSLPIILSAVFFSLVTMAMSQWMLPVTLSATNKIWYEKVNESIPKGIVRNGRFFYKGTNGFYSFLPSNSKEQYKRFSYVTWNNAYEMQLMLNAKTAVWLGDKWLFSHGQIQRQAGSNQNTIEFFEQLSLQLPENPSNFFIPEYKDKERSITQIYKDIIEEDEQANVTSRLEFHGKVSYILLGLPLILLGLPMLILIHQRWGRDIALAVPASCGLAFLAWAWWGAFQSMAKAAYISPFIASWSVHILIGGLGIFLLNQQNT